MDKTMLNLGHRLVRAHIVRHGKINPFGSLQALSG